MGTLLCVGLHPYDVALLVPVVRDARDRLGLEPVFVSVAPPEDAAAVWELAEAEGFSALDRPLMALDDPTIRNPLRRARQQRDATMALIHGLLDEVRPTAVLASVSSSPGVFLDESARRGIPTIFVQMFHWGDRAFYREWFHDERRAYEATRPRRGRLRRRIKHRIRVHYGLGPFVVWDVHRATLAVQGPALARRLIAEGVAPELVVVTGNAMLDEIFRLRADAAGARRRVRAQLSIPEAATLVVQMRSYEQRLTALDPADRDEGQVRIVGALQAAAPNGQVVIKVHPKAGPEERAELMAIDPRLIVVGEEVSTNELILAADVMVSTASTTLLQAVLLDVPTVSVWLWPGLDYFRRITDWSAVDRTDSPEALTDAVRRHLTDDAYRARWAAARAAFVRDEFRFDGEGTTRVVDLLATRIRAASSAPAASRP